MKRTDIIKYFKLLQKTNLSGAEITLAINKNKRLFEKEVRDINGASQIDPEFKKYKEEREQLFKSYATKDEKGKAKTKQIPIGLGKTETVYDIPNVLLNEDSVLMEKSNALDGRFSNAIENQKTIDKNFREVFLEKDIELNLSMISFEDVPKNISQTDMDAIWWMIKEEPKK